MIKLLSLAILYNRSDERGGTITIKVKPGAIWSLVPFDFLLPIYFNMLWGARLNRDQIFLDFDVFEAFILIKVSKSLLKEVIRAKLFSRPTTYGTLSSIILTFFSSTRRSHLFLTMARE